MSPDASSSHLLHCAAVTCLCFASGFYPTIKSFAWVMMFLLLPW